MISPKVKTRVARATVRLSRTGGRGVLVPGGYVLTAAHCIKWVGTGRMLLLGDHFVEEVKTADSRKFLLSPHAVEPVTDIAVLGEPDPAEFAEEAEAFEAFREAVEGVPMSAHAPEWGQPAPVYVLARDGKWIPGTVTRQGHPVLPGGGLTLKIERPLRGGDSGGPVVDGEGNLVGVVSNGKKIGTIPLAYLALPRWVGDGIITAQTPGAEEANFAREREAVLNAAAARVNATGVVSGSSLPRVEPVGGSAGSTPPGPRSGAACRTASSPFGGGGQVVRGRRLGQKVGHGHPERQGQEGREVDPRRRAPPSSRET
jgi:hypothetical protein